MLEKANLLVDLADERFGRPFAGEVQARLASLGIRLEDRASTDAHQVAWIDRHFGGSWSAESHAGRNWFAYRDGALIGFCAYAVHGFDFAWLANWRNRADVGIFGPLGVAAQARGCGIGAALTLLGLHSLRRDGFAYALIPAVDPLSGAAFYARVSGATIAERFNA